MKTRDRGSILHTHDVVSSHHGFMYMHWVLYILITGLIATFNERVHTERYVYQAHSLTLIFLKKHFNAPSGHPDPP